MLILALDTAGPCCQAALGRVFLRGDVEALAARSEPLPRGHAERLLPMIAEMLAETGLRYAHLDAVAVTTGPGSFTGVRIGVAAARGLAVALAVPAIGVGTLDALLEGPRRQRRTGLAVAALDARRGEIFAAARECHSGRDVFPAAATTASALARVLGDMRRDPLEPVRLTGSGAAMVAAELGAARVEVAGVRAAPDMRDVLALAALADAGGLPIPTYLRDPDARPQTAMAAVLAAAPL